MPEYDIVAVSVNGKPKLVLKITLPDEQQAIEAAQNVNCDAERTEIWCGRKFIANVWRD